MTATQQKLAHHDFCMTDCGYGKADMGLAKLKRLQWVASSLGGWLLPAVAQGWPRSVGPG
jgi:hypothetical protein